MRLMSKWFEAMEQGKTNIIYSRIRLTRNWAEYAFPASLSREQREEALGRLEQGLSEIAREAGPCRFRRLDSMQELDRLALRERRVINKGAAQETEPCGLYLSEDESCSLALCCDDHIRIQFLAPGLALEELWQKADALDDRVSEQFSYAFDDKYGYLTSFPTNVGTGLKASVVLHLPTLSQIRKFQSIVGDMSRFGTSIRGLYGEGSDNWGSLYELSNQRTLGQSEKEIVEQVMKAAVQLNNQELRVRSATLDNQRLEREDETYKSYGILKYARKITEKDARIFLSQLMAGEEDELIRFEKKAGLYSLFLGIKPGNLKLWSRRPLDKEELDCVRAAYLRQNLPEIAK